MSDYISIIIGTALTFFTACMFYLWVNHLFRDKITGLRDLIYHVYDSIEHSKLDRGWIPNEKLPPDAGENVKLVEARLIKETSTLCLKVKNGTDRPAITYALVLYFEDAGVKYRKLREKIPPNRTYEFCIEVEPDEVSNLDKLREVGIIFEKVGDHWNIVLYVFCHCVGEIRDSFTKTEVKHI